MHMPSVTAGYLAILALLYAILSLAVIRLRQRNLAPFGDGGNAALRNAIRAHANFIEYAPIIMLMVAFLEMAGTPATRVHVLMGALVLSRLLHPLGMCARPGTLPFWICRAGGILITIGLLITCAITTLSRSVAGGMP